MQSGACLVIGIGNPHCGDDGVGRLVARRLDAQGAAGLQVVEHAGDAAGLLEWLTGPQAAYLIDASKMGKPPGTISRFDVTRTQLPRVALSCSTHGLGVADAIELARALGRLPPRCVIYAIEGRRYDIGDALSPEVDAAAEEVANLIRDELGHRHTG